MKFRFLLKAALFSVVILFSVGVLSAGAVGVTINGTPVAFDDTYGYPFVDSANRTQVPFRLTMETFGCIVGWEEESHTAVAQKDGVTVKVPLGEPYILVDGRKTPIDTVSVIVNDRIYLPIRAVLEAFGACVDWEEETSCVTVSTGDSILRVYFFDVGQGDCALIDYGDREVLIDAGDNNAGAAVVSYLKPFVDGKLDYVIATHPDADHIGGLDDVLAAFEVGEVIDSGRASTSANYRKYWAAVQNEAGCTYATDENRTIVLGSGAVLSIIETGDDWDNNNDSSVVAQLVYQDVSVLFVGDMSETVEKANLSLFGDVDVLKVGHHGSASSSSTAFLNVVKPEYAVISYKVGNSYHHPTGSALQRLFNVGAVVYGTGKSGTICLTTDGHAYSFDTQDALTMEDKGA